MHELFDLTTAHTQDKTIDDQKELLD